MTTMHIGNEGQGHATNIVGWPDGQLNPWWMSWNQTSMMVAFILCKEAIVLVLNDLKLIGKCVGYKLNAQLFVACCPTFYYSWAFLQAIFTWLYQASFLYYAFCFKLIWFIYMSLPEFPLKVWALIWTIIAIWQQTIHVIWQRSCAFMIVVSSLTCNHLWNECQMLLFMLSRSILAMMFLVVPVMNS